MSFRSERIAAKLRAVVVDALGESVADYYTIKFEFNSLAERADSIASSFDASPLHRRALAGGERTAESALDDERNDEAYLRGCGLYDGPVTP